jgi:hypothetical protein
VDASGNPAPTYQWQRLAAGSTVWTDLTEGGSYRGVLGETLTINAPTAVMSGDQFRCVTTSAVGSAISNAATLTVGGSARNLFQSPVGLTIDGAGNLYVADAGANTICKVNPAGQVTTLAGSPVPSARRMARPVTRDSTSRAPFPRIPPAISTSPIPATQRFGKSPRLESSPRSPARRPTGATATDSAAPPGSTHLLASPWAPPAFSTSQTP